VCQTNTGDSFAGVCEMFSSLSLKVAASRISLVNRDALKIDGKQPSFGPTLKVLKVQRQRRDCDSHGCNSVCGIVHQVCTRIHSSSVSRQTRSKQTARRDRLHFRYCDRSPSGWRGQQGCTRSVQQSTFTFWTIRCTPIDFSQVLKCPKSDVEVIRGVKSRDKTVAVAGIDTKGDEKSCISKIRQQLESSMSIS